MKPSYKNRQRLNGQITYNDALSNLRLDNRSQDAQMLFYLSTDLRCAEATIHVTPENHLGERSGLSAVLLRLVLPPVVETGSYFSFACVRMCAIFKYIRMILSFQTSEEHF